VLGSTLKKAAGGNRMGDYVRTTSECEFEDLHPLLASAIRHHIDRYELGDIERSALMCCETTSTKKKKGLFGGKTEVIRTGVVVTPRWLIWASGKEGEVPGVLSARLQHIRVQDYEKSELYKMMQDTGLNVLGLRTGSNDLGSVFIGLGPEPAAQKLREVLREAIAKV
jgi:hypothetical protein